MSKEYKQGRAEVALELYELIGRLRFDEHNNGDAIVAALQRRLGQIITDAKED